MGLDAVINCTLFERPNDPTKNCQALSGMNQPLQSGTFLGDLGAFTFVATPIFPRNDPDTLTGFIFGAIWWTEVMPEVYPEDAQGIDCVLQGVFGDDTESVYSYAIEHGSGVFRGEGDHHDSDYDEYAVSEVIMEG